MNEEQPELPLTPADDLERALERQWADNARAQAWQWTPEHLAMVWWSGCPEYGADPEGFAALPSYQRESWIREYEHQCAQREATGRPMPTAAHVVALREEHYQHMRQIAESWAQDIRQAFLKGLPCPIKPEPAFETVLAWAFQLAQVPAACLQPQPQCPSE